MSDSITRKNKAVRILVFFLWIGLLLILAIGVLLVEETWRGRRAWERCKREFEEQGEKLDANSFIPPPVPDEQNFAMAPLFVPLNDYVKDPKSGEEVPRDPSAVERLKSVSLSKLNANSQAMPNRGAWQVGKMVGIDEWQRWLLGKPSNPEAAQPQQAARDVLAVLEKYSSEMAEFSRAAERPFARFPLQYEKGFAMPMRHTGVLLGFSGVFYLRAIAELETGETEAALQDIKTLDRAGMALQGEPLLISHLVRLTLLSDILQIVWRGMAQHRWNADQLKTLQIMLSRLDLLTDYQKVMRGERALMNDHFDRLRRKGANLYASAFLAPGIEDSRPRPLKWAGRLLPQGAVLYHNQVCQNRWIQELVLPMVNASAGRVYPRAYAAAEEIQRQTTTTPYNFLAKLALPVYPSVIVRIAATDVFIRQAMVACALERFRISHREFPEALNKLVPDYLSQSVQDIFVDQRLRYHREGRERYVLYSVGWNEEDDGGAIETKPGHADRRDDQSGDWVWPCAEGK